MKTFRFFYSLLIAFLLLFASSCNNEEDAIPSPQIPGKVELSTEAKEYLTVSSQVNQLLNSGPVASLNLSPGGLMNPSGRSSRLLQGKRRTSFGLRTSDDDDNDDDHDGDDDEGGNDDDDGNDDDHEGDDKGDHDGEDDDFFGGLSDDDLPPCAVYTTIQNPDGSTTSIIDFGSGCTYDGHTYQGKIINTVWTTEDSNAMRYTFRSESEMIGFEMDTSSVNGNFVYTGEWAMTLNGENVDFEGNGSHMQDFTLVTPSESYEVTGTGTERYTLASLTVLTGTQAISTGSGQTFTYNVVEPLVQDFSCYDYYDDSNDDHSGGDDTESDDDHNGGADDHDNDYDDFDFPLYTQGVENHTYPGGEISIDYGDGTCDSIVTVTENGVTTVVDWYELFNW